MKSLCPSSPRGAAPTRIVPFVLLVMVLAVLVPPAASVSATDAPGAPSALAVGAGQVGAAGTVRDDQPDATDGGFVPVVQQIIVPSAEIGLTRERPIPLGATCSCTIDRVGLTSQFNITVVRVVPDAIAMIQQLNRFNPPPMAGYRYVAVYVGQQYVAGPQNQAYTTTDSDWKATSTNDRLRDVEQIFHIGQEYRPRADVYPGNYVNGWLYFVLPIDKPAYLGWNYNFLGERAVWFALQ